MIWRITDIGSATSAPPKRWWPANDTRRQVLCFLVVGITCVVVDLAVYRLLGWTLGMRLDVAKAISYWAGVCVGFVGNKLWTFQSSRKSLAEPAAYAAQYCVTMFANVGCNRLVLTLLGPEATAIAYITATGVSTVLNFVGLRLFTFRRGLAERQLPSVVKIPLTTTSDASTRRRAA